MDNNMPGEKERIDLQEEELTSSDMAVTEIGNAPETSITATDQEQEDLLYGEFLEHSTKRIKVSRFVLHKE